MTARRAIDLNCDLGELPHLAPVDEQLVRSITSANIACGGHAGDLASMLRTARLCLEHGVATGAHPSYPDRANFGRIHVEMPPPDITRAVADQLRALLAVLQSLSAPLTHVKPHGALYHAAASDSGVALAIARAVKETTPSSAVVGPAGSPALAIWRDEGLRTRSEAFADRVYEPSGLLRSRSLPASLIEDPDAAARQALEIARGRLATSSGHVLDMTADTLCIHSDTPSSPAIARAVRTALESASVTVRA